MRILHTSDWHLGRSFHRVGMLGHQAAFIDHLVEVVRAQSVDVVIVAGDVYDRALPSVDTVRLLNEAVERLVDSGAQLLITSGNHDSADRLGFGGRVLERGGVHLRTKLDDLARPVLVSDDHGPVALYGVPYLEPALVADRLEAERSHQSVLTAAARRIRTDLAGRPAGTRSVLAAHAFVVGGQVSDSERDISVGGVSAVPAQVLQGIDYVALGHLHRRQRISESVRYSGSPLAYSFAEAGHRKGSWLVDLGADGPCSIEPVDAPVPRPLATLRGELEQLLTDPRHRDAEGAWCQVILTDTVRPAAAMERLQARFPHALVVGFEPNGQPGREISYTQRVRGRSQLDVCCGFLEHVRDGQPVSSSDRALLGEAIEGGRRAVDEADLNGRRVGAA